ncbi:hypothetical protein Dsin_015625 [Dipteronia sinensis]|uniref:DUF4283 domain-containing protein n=1 Tax=Dipteronia sinensis TaxID=43782 RepID=A0AAE0E4V4_9ROSI|nr:hypothetical protein Dsin_015625 [Dipteronia sinensis]
MSFEEVVMLYANMTLLEEEGPMGRLQDDLKEDGLRRLALSLVGKVLTNKKVNGEAFMGLISRVWKVRKEDHWHVIMGRPWTFVGALIVLAGPSGKRNVECMDFTHAEFWVQIHRVSLLCMPLEIGRFLGSMVGEVKEVEKTDMIFEGRDTGRDTRVKFIGGVMSGGFEFKSKRDERVMKSVGLGLVGFKKPKPGDKGKENIRPGIDFLPMSIGPTGGQIINGGGQQIEVVSLGHRSQRVSLENGLEQVDPINPTPSQDETIDLGKELQIRDLGGKNEVGRDGGARRWKRRAHKRIKTRPTMDLGLELGK